MKIYYYFAIAFWKYIIILQLLFCLFENNLRTGAMARHVNEHLFLKVQVAQAKKHVSS
jgi:hypothetical protein